MRLFVGGTAKTTNCQIEYLFESGVESADRVMDRNVATWIHQNEKALNKAGAGKAVRLMMDEFPELLAVEVRDYTFRLAKGTR